MNRSICKSLIFAMLLGLVGFLPTGAHAAYDGVWIGTSQQDTGFFMITQVSNGDYGMIEFGLDPNSPYYMTYYGSANRMNLLLDSAPNGCPDYFVVEFQSESTATMTLYPREDVSATCQNPHYGIPFQIVRF